MMYLFMRNITEQRETKIDFTSIFLSIIGFGSMLYGFTQLQDGGPIETLTIISLSVGALALVLFTDRKSTRLNSSHVAISYAVFCLKKKINLNYKTVLRRLLIY